MFASLRSRLWLSYVLVIGVVLGVVGLAIFIYLLRNPLVYRQEVTRLRLAVNALGRERLLGAVEGRPAGAVQRADEFFDVRVLLLNADGSLLVDSRSGEEPPVPPVRIPPAGTAPLPIRTFRDADGQVWLYTGVQLQEGRSLLVAAPRPRPPALAILRDEFFAPMVQAAALSVLVSLGLAYLMSRWVAAPLQRIEVAARAAAQGEYRPIEPQGPREVQSLARAFNDMTARVQASQQSQRDFVANVSHELKTPLTSIQGFAQAVLDGTADSPEAARRAAQVIHDEAGRMHRLVLDLLDLARLDAGTADLQRAPLDLAATLRGVVEKLAPLSAEAQVELRAHIEPLPRFVGDGDRLAQVVTNLVDNALKHTPAGGRVELRARAVDGGVEIAVGDNGPGIPPDELGRIFERFYQVDKSRQGGKWRGVGLGLAIARQIVEAHGGRLNAHSHVGEGSTFVVRLPAVRPDDSTISARRR